MTNSATEILAKLRAKEECLNSKPRTEYVALAEMKENNGDPVVHPDHYQGNGYEVLDIIEDFELNFNLGNVLKYVLRAGRKNSELKEEDLEKALFYLKREVEYED